MRRRGYTLVEVTIFAAVGLIVISGVWSFFRSSMTRSKATDIKLEGLQGAILIARRIEGDLAYLYEDYDHEATYERVPEQGATFAFWRYHPDAARNPGATWGSLPLQRVEYRYVAAERRLYRRVDADPPRALYGYVESLDFWNPQQDEDEFGAGGALGMAPSYAFYVTCSPRGLLRLSLEERDKKALRARTTLAGAAVRERRMVERKYPYWNRVPYWPEPAPASPGG